MYAEHAKSLPKCCDLKIKGSENHYGEARVCWPQDRDRYRGDNGDICVSERGTGVALLERRVEPYARASERIGCLLIAVIYISITFYVL